MKKLTVAKIVCLLTVLVDRGEGGVCKLKGVAKGKENNKAMKLSSACQSSRF